MKDQKFERGKNDLYTIKIKLKTKIKHYPMRNKLVDFISEETDKETKTKSIIIIHVGSQKRTQYSSSTF